MGDLEIPEQEIKLLKDAFQFYVKESCSVIADLTVYTSGYLRAELEDDDMMGPHWITSQEAPRLNLPRLQSDFFQTVKRMFSPAFVLGVLKSSPTLSARLIIPLEESEWVISIRQLAFVLWKVIMEPYLEKCWAKHNQILFDDQIFDDAFEATLEDIQAPCVETEIHLTPISNINLTVGSVDLAPTIKLRPIAPDEVEVWLNHLHYFLNERPSLGDYLRSQCAIEVTYCRQAGYYALDNLIRRMDLFNEHVETTTRVLGAVRLVTDHTAHVLFTQQTRYGFLERRREISFPQTPKPLAIGANHFVIDDHLASELVSIWKRLETSDLAADVNLPFRRWFGAADRLNDADRLIDYWIAFESLFSPDSTQEVKFRVSLRIAAYLGETSDEREAIYEDMRHSYDWRSAVVHGTKPKTQKKLNKRGTLQIVTANTRTYLRRALLMLLKSDQPLKIGPKESELILLRRLGENSQE